MAQHGKVLLLANFAAHLGGKQKGPAEQGLFLNSWGKEPFGLTSQTAVSARVDPHIEGVLARFKLTH